MTPSKATTLAALLALTVFPVFSGGEPELTIRNQFAPFPQIIAAGQPTEEELTLAASLGYKTIVNLRSPGEKGELPDEEKLVRAAGMNYVLIPISGPDGINLENAQKLADVLEGADALPAIVHCASSNRVGALFALKAARLDGKSTEESIEIGKSAGMTRLEPVVRELLETED